MVSFLFFATRMLGQSLSKAPPDSTFLSWMNPTTGDSGAFWPRCSSYANEKQVPVRAEELLSEVHSFGARGKALLTSPSGVPWSSKQPAQPHRAALCDFIESLKKVPHTVLQRAVVTRKV